MPCHPQILEESRVDVKESLAIIGEALTVNRAELLELIERVLELEKQLTCNHEKFHSPPSVGFNTDTCLECGWQYSY
jgi:hypothetical protein